ncbi:MAG TPA: hypothetical protein VKB88_43335 [Bryobacteraceae bacterium]|nr:hypothetical protein [Bryobacteraceae bacterium]
MVSALAIGLCAVFTPAPLHAQSEKAGQKLEQLSSQLGLSPEQKRQLIPILVTEAPKVKAIKADSSLTRIQKLQQIKAIHDEIDPQVKGILSPEQYQKLQAIRRQELQRIVEKKLNQ